MTPPAAAPQEPLPVQAYVPGEEALFAFLEDSLRGAVAAPPLTQHASAVHRVLELANDDWPEHDAVRELLRLLEGERRVLQRTHVVLQGGLLRTMLPNVTAIHADRLVQAALRQSSQRAKPQVPRHDRRRALGT